MARILIVEDESHIAEGLVFNLEAEGFDAVVASTGDEAVDYLTAASSDFDLVILDIMLPGMSGFEVARRARAAGNLAAILMPFRGQTAGRNQRGLPMQC